MRILILTLAILALPACTSLLVGDSSSSETVVGTDERSSAEVASDNAISAAIRRQLSSDTLVREFAIGIRTVDSNVTLTGTVGSYPARDRAIQIANNTDGVRGVNNRIMVNTNL